MGSLRQSPGEFAAAYFERASALRSELILSGQPMGETATLVQLTAGLQPSLLVVACAHMDFRADPTMSSLKISLRGSDLTHEQAASNASIEQVAIEQVATEMLLLKCLVTEGDMQKQE